MRKDLWIGGIAATVAHSAVVWFSLFQAPSAVKAPPGQELSIVQVLIPPPPPEELDASDTVDEHPEVGEAPPSLPDLPSPSMADVFIQPLQPNPPATKEGMTTIPLDIGVLANPELRTWDLSELSKQPVAVSTPHPQYPFAMRSAGIEGTVVVDFVVDAQGNVLRPKALEGASREFADAAVEGLRRWHFRPGMKDGRAVMTHMQIPLVFSLQK